MLYKVLPRDLGCNHLKRSVTQDSYNLAFKFQKAQINQAQNYGHFSFHKVQKNFSRTSSYKRNFIFLEKLTSLTLEQ